MKVMTLQFPQASALASRRLRCFMQHVSSSSSANGQTESNITLLTPVVTYDPKTLAQGKSTNKLSIFLDLTKQSAHHGKLCFWHFKNMFQMGICVIYLNVNMHCRHCICWKVWQSFDILQRVTKLPYPDE